MIRAPGGPISMPAVDWCARMGIAISFVASDSALLNCLIPDAPHDGPIKRAQAISAVTDDAMVLARHLLGQEDGVAGLCDRARFSRLGIGSGISRKAAVSQIRTCIGSIAARLQLVDFLTLEGRPPKSTGTCSLKHLCPGVPGH